MTVAKLLDPATVRSQADLGGLTGRSWNTSHFAYLIWDLQPRPNWLPNDHPKRQHLSNDRYRPLYLGKAAGWSSVARHLTKDRFGAGTRLPTDKNAINEGLLAYCLAKGTAGWLGMSVQAIASQEEAQSVEQEGVRLLGWRGDVRRLKLLKSAEVKAAIGRGEIEWRKTLSELRERYAELLETPMPLSEGLLLNQTDPARDGRGML